jgi:hypothetical protein
MPRRSGKLARYDLRYIYRSAKPSLVQLIRQKTKRAKSIENSHHKIKVVDPPALETSLAPLNDRDTASPVQ